MSFKSRFEIRVTPELVRKVKHAAEWKKMTPTMFVRDAIKEKVEKTLEEWRRWKAGQPDAQDNAQNL